MALLGRATADGTSLNLSAIRTFIALNFAGGFGLLVVILTAFFSPNVTRVPTWYNFCASWIFSCISYTLLTFGGQQITDSPTRSLCFAQAVLIYAVPPLTSCTTLALLIQILHNFSDTIANLPNRKIHRSPPSLLLGPYFIFLVVLLGLVLSESQGPSTIAKSARGTYCYSTNLTWQRVSYGFVGGVSLLILVVQVHLAFRIYRSSHIMTRGSPCLTTALRGMLFSVIGVLTVFVAIALAITQAQSLTLDIILASLPTLALVVFGSQHDLIYSWFCCVYSRKYE